MWFLLIFFCFNFGYFGAYAMEECVGNERENTTLIIVDNAKSEWKWSENRLHFRVKYSQNLINFRQSKFSLNASLSMNFSTAIDINSTVKKSAECANLTLGSGEFKLRKQDYEGFQKMMKDYKGDPKLLSLMYRDFKFKLDFSITSANLGFVSYNGSCLHLTVSKLNPNQNLDEMQELNLSSCVHLIKVVDLAPNISAENVNIAIVRDFINHSLFKFNSSAISFSLQDLNFTFANLSLDNFVALNTEVLDFSHSNISIVLDHDFPYFPSLRSLSMENCNLRYIGEKALINLPNLTYLNLGGNALSAIPRNPTSLLNLVYLNLSGNTFFMSGSLAHLTNLKSLDLSNAMVEDYDFPLAVMEQLEVLNFSRTQFVNLTGLYTRPLPNAFPNIRRLYLSESIASAYYIFNYTFPLLNTLDLSRNNLTYEPQFDAIFSHFPRLKYLDMSGNNFDRLIEIDVNNDEIFLDLSRNNISGWNESKVRLNNNDTNLTLDLSNNKISVVNSEMLRDLSAAKTQVFLDNNVFDCRECIVEAFYKYLVQNQITRYTCEFPLNKKGLFIVDLNIDPEFCLERVFNYLLKVILPLSMVTAIVIVAVALSIKYKWYLRFFCYLLRHRILSKRKRNDANGSERLTFDAFVCYSSIDSDWVVNQLIPHLEQDEPRLHLCIHDRDFLAGGFIINNIIDCIDISRKTLCLITKSFTASQWCQYELYLAHNKLFEEGNDGLILILLEDLDDGKVPRTLQRLMRTRTYLVWPDPNNEPACRLFWARLKRSLGQCNCLQLQNEFYSNEQI